MEREPSERAGVREECEILAKIGNRAIERACADAAESGQFKTRNEKAKTQKGVNMVKRVELSDRV